MSDHAHVPPNSLIAGRYRVVREAGTGNFARVFVCADTRRNNAPVAVKLLKRGFDRDAEYEREVLAAINKKDPDDRSNVVKMLSFFKWNDHSCFAFSLKGGSLKCKLGTNNKMTRSQVASLARDLAEAMHFLHNTSRIIHTDLKPENLLVEENVERWVVCDFGSASFIQEVSDSDLISTRPYRAPEVVLGSEWTSPVDMWSVGCILFEAYVGTKLFEAMQDDAHLSLMEHHLGPIPDSMVRKGSPKVVRQCFGPDGRLKASANRHRRLSDLLREDPEFMDLMSCLLRYEPHRRMRAQDMLMHPFVLTAVAKTSQVQSIPTTTLSQQQQYPSYSAATPPLNATRMTAIPPLGLERNLSSEISPDASPGSVGSAGYHSNGTNSPLTERNYTTAAASPRYTLSSHQQQIHQQIQQQQIPSTSNIMSPGQRPVMLPGKYWPRETTPRVLTLDDYHQQQQQQRPSVAAGYPSYTTTSGHGYTTSNTTTMTTTPRGSTSTVYHVPAGAPVRYTAASPIQYDRPPLRW